MLMVMTLVVPGSAQLVAGNRRVGRIATRIWAGLVLLSVAAMGTATLHHQYAFSVRVRHRRLLGVVRLVLMVLAMGWAALFLDAWRIGQPLSLTAPAPSRGGRAQRRPLLLRRRVRCCSARTWSACSAASSSRCSPVTTSPAAHDGRFNVLLVGGDSGAGRWGLRTDSMTVASIDAGTGKTVLIGLPRNMTNFPFAKGSVMHKAWPHGFDCGYPNCELNGINTWVGDHQRAVQAREEPRDGRPRSRRSRASPG